MVLLSISVAGPVVSRVTPVADFDFLFDFFFEVSGARRPDGAGTYRSGQTMGATWGYSHPIVSLGLTDYWSQAGTEAK